MNKVLVWSSKLFLALILGLLVAAWVMWMVQTPDMLAQFELAASTATGLIALKTGMGGAVLTVAVFIVLYFVRGKQWLFPLAISSGVLLLSRLIAALEHGINGVVLFGLASEALIVVACLYLHRQSQPNTNTDE